MADQNTPMIQKPLSGVLLREATSEDDAQIRTLFRRNAMSGRISLAADCDPSFFAAIEIEGWARRTMVAESEQKIVGVVSMAKRRMFLNGAPADAGYAGSLRLDRSIRRTTIMSQGLLLVKQWHQESFDVPFYLFAILNDNMAARNVLTSGRVGLPPSQYIGTLYAAGIPLMKRRLPRPPTSVRVVRGAEVGAAAIAEFLNRIGREKQFFPVYTAEDIMKEDQILRGLGLNDFYVALSGNQISGVMSCWDQSLFRRIVVTGYSGYMRWLKPIIATFCKATHLAPIPAPGEPLRNLYAACIAIRENNRQIFTLLLNTILHDRYNTGHSFLIAGLMACDPLLPALKKFLHVPSRTGIYSLSLDGTDTANQLDGRVPYLELASL
ncbi:MAG: hypothetical protein K4571_05500 [Deltaproteobacteria bacterium]